MTNVTSSLKALAESNDPYKTASLQVEARRWDASFTPLGYQIWQEKGGWLGSVDWTQIIRLPGMG